MSATINHVRAMARALPGVEEWPCHGTPAFYVRGKIFLRLREDGETLVVAFSREDREGLIDRQPDVFSVTEHYRNYDYVLLDLAAVDGPCLRRMIEGAWRLKAAKREVAAYDAARPTGGSP